MSSPSVGIVILNWNGWRDTIECLESLSKITYPNYKIVVVDNGSKDNSADNLQKRFPNIKLVKNPDNLGFAGGNNVGIRESLKSKADYVLLLNNDTTVEPDFLDRLVEAITGDEKIGIASPKIMFYREPDNIWFVGGGFLPWLKKPFHKYYGERDSKQVKATTEVDWVSGCCMLIKREVFGKIGLLDADYFNNYEDVDFCVRAKKAGYKIVIVPEAKIYHKFAASMGGKFSPFYTYFRTRNNLLFFKKTKQWLPLLLNLMVFPIYSVVESIKNRQFQSIKTTSIAIADFFKGNYGVGSAAGWSK
jgi:GT2 family glycosyltransferase